jgi:hypothetical protein
MFNQAKVEGCLQGNSRNRLLGFLSQGFPSQGTEEGVGTDELDAGKRWWYKNAELSEMPFKRTAL